MLAAIGVGSVDELFESIPEGVRLGRALDLPAGMAEQDVYAHLRELAARNVSAEDEITFLGAGMYDHYVPAVIDMLMTRCEFLTPYTPYQPEISQGGLQVMFEYQTAISELTALPVSNASVYEGPSAVASAGYLAKIANGKPKFVVSRGVHPHSRETLRHVRARLRRRGRRGRPARRRHRPRRLGRGDRRRHRRRLLPAAELPRRGRGRRGAGRRGQGLAGRRRRRPTTRCRWASSSRPASAASTSASARARRWATAWTSAGRRSGSSPRPRRTCAACPAGSPARRPTSTASAASC